MNNSRALRHTMPKLNSPHGWFTIGAVLCMTLGFVLNAFCQTASNWVDSGRAALASTGFSPSVTTSIISCPSGSICPFNPGSIELA